MRNFASLVLFLMVAANPEALEAQSIKLINTPFADFVPIAEFQGKAYGIHYNGGIEQLIEFDGANERHFNVPFHLDGRSGGMTRETHFSGIFSYENKLYLMYRFGRCAGWETFDGRRLEVLPGIVSYDSAGLTGFSNRIPVELGGELFLNFVNKYESASAEDPGDFVRFSAMGGIKSCPFPVGWSSAIPIGTFQGKLLVSLLSGSANGLATFEGDKFDVISGSYDSRLSFTYQMQADGMLYAFRRKFPNGNNQLSVYDGTSWNIVPNPDGGRCEEPIVEYNRAIFFIYEDESGLRKIAKYAEGKISLFENPSERFVVENGFLVVFNGTLYCKIGRNSRSPGGQEAIYSQLCKCDGSQLTAIENPDFTWSMAREKPFVSSNRLFLGYYPGGPGTTDEVLGAFDGTGFVFFHYPEGVEGYSSPFIFNGQLTLLLETNNAGVRWGSLDFHSTSPNPVRGQNTATSGLEGLMGEVAPNLLHQDTAAVAHGAFGNGGGTSGGTAISGDHAAILDGPNGKVLHFHLRHPPYPDDGKEENYDVVRPKMGRMQAAFSNDQGNWIARVSDGAILFNLNGENVSGAWYPPMFLKMFYPDPAP